MALAEKIVGKGVTIVSASYTGHPSSAGIFRKVPKRFGIDSGIILTSGRATDAVGQATNLADSRLNRPGNPLLTTYSGQATLDASVLTFDFIPQGDSINVNFVFASDEYPVFNCQTFNDVFAFLISGPGFTGVQNIALVPGTNIPVSINSINNGTAVGGNTTLCTSLGPGSPFTNLYVDNEVPGNPTFDSVAYNGYTQVLVARAQVQSCQVYRITLAIADAFDQSMDSGVFIEAGSFSSNAIDLVNEGGFTDGVNQNILVEGCTSGKLRLKLRKSFSSPVNVNLTYGGTATAGVDYQSLPATVTFAPGESEKVLDVIPVVDNIAEPTETLVVSVVSIACGVPSNVSTVTLYLKDSIAFTRIKDTFVCSAFPTVLKASKVDTATTNNWQWYNGNTTQQVAITVPGKYWSVNTFNKNCYNIDSFRVVNGDPLLQVGGNVSICDKDSLLVTAVVLPAGGTYVWSNGSVANQVWVKQAGTYTATYTAPNGCYVSSSFSNVVKPLPYPMLGNDTALCTYERLPVNAFYPGATYNWNTGATTAAINISDTGTYIVTNTLNGCAVKDTIVVTRKRTPVADAGHDQSILQGGIARLEAVRDAANDQYNWSPANLLNSSSVYNPQATPLTTTDFYLKVVSLDNCTMLDTVRVVVKPFYLDVPNAFSPNNDGINDVWNIPMLSSYLKASVQVFNRNGQVVYQSRGYDKPWDGTSNGKPAPTGVYYYIIEPGGNKVRQTGTLTIIR